MDKIVLSKEAYQKTEIGKIPRDWKVKKINEIAEVNKENLSGNTPAEYEFYYYDLSSVEKGKVYHPTEKIKFADAPSRAKRLFKRNDVLMSTVRPNLQGFTYVDFDSENSVCSTGFAVIAGEYESDSMYLYQNLFSYGITRQIQKLLVGSNYPAINSKDVENLKVPFPNDKKEREKIASILSTWDKAIELKEKLIEQKKEQKKGLMQKLLTGEVRLLGFEGEWREVKLGKIGKTYNGLSGKTAEDFGEGKPYIPYKTIFDDSKINLQKLDYVKINIGEKQNSAKKGDIFFTTSSETPHEVGMSSVLLDDVDEIYLNSFCFGYRLNDFSVLLPNFAQHYFRSDDFRKKIYALAQGSTRFNISKNEVMKIAIKIPDLKEQEGISKILSESDKEILLLANQVRRLKEQKQGLMQLLLTGKVRVKV